MAEEDQSPWALRVCSCMSWSVTKESVDNLKAGKPEYAGFIPIEDWRCETVTLNMGAEMGKRKT